MKTSFRSKVAQTGAKTEIFCNKEQQKKLKNVVPWEDGFGSSIKLRGFLKVKMKNYNH